MIEIYGKENCNYCTEAKKLCESKDLPYLYYELGSSFTRDELLEMFPSAKTFPQIKVDDSPIGGFNQLKALYA